jgi:uncharacterized LabA/DUF88 family protein
VIKFIGVFLFPKGVEPMTSPPRIAVFIDGANLYHASVNLGFQMNFEAIKKMAKAEGFLLRSYYYTAMKENEGGFNGLRQLVDWLEYNEFTVKTKEMKVYDGKFKGNMDVELVVDALVTCPHWDKMYLFSGDGDFTYLVNTLKQLGKTVRVISTIKTNPPMASDALRRAADEFLDLHDLRTVLGR